MLLDAPPTIGHNIQRAVDEIASANGVSNKVTYLIYSHHHADHAGASSLFDKNVTRIGHEETRRLLLRDDDPARPPNEETFQDRRTLEIGGERIDLAWHGANHSPDNIIIHLPDHDTLMLIDIVNPGWAPVYVSNLTEDIPGYIEAPANALAYSWKHFIGGHLGRLGTRDDVTLHQQYMADIAESSRKAIDTVDPTRYFVKYGENTWAAVKGYLDEVTRGRRRARDREVHRRARGRRRLHREHDVLGDGVDPARPRLRLPGASLMAAHPARDPVAVARWTCVRRDLPSEVARARTALRVAVHGDPGRVDRERGAAVDRAVRCTSRRRELQWVAERVRVDVRRVPAARRACRRDLFGRRRIFMVGLVVFAAASLACGLSNSTGTLDRCARRSGSRCGDHLAGGALDPDDDVRRGHGAQHRARRVGRDRRERRRGRRAPRRRRSRTTVGWEWIFFINVPIAVIVIALRAGAAAREPCRERRAPLRRRRRRDGDARTRAARVRARGRRRRIRGWSAPHARAVRGVGDPARLVRRDRDARGRSRSCRCRSSGCARVDRRQRRRVPARRVDLLDVLLPVALRSSSCSATRR